MTTGLPLAITPPPNHAAGAADAPSKLPQTVDIPATGGAEPVRLTLVIASLAAGGAERVLSTLATAWAEGGYQVTLVTLYPEAHDFFSVSRRVRRVIVGHTRVSGSVFAAIASNVRRLLRLRRVILESRPEVVISFMDEVNVLTLLASLGTRQKVVVSERTVPSVHRIGRSWSALRRLTYRRAAAVVVQSPEVAEWVNRIAAEVPAFVVPNPVLVRSATGRDGSPGTPDDLHRRVACGRSIVAMGRLAEEKGFDLLIRAFAAGSAQWPEWSLIIVGEGPERPHLEQLRRQLGVEASVCLPGRVQDPGSLLEHAELFVLSSRYEGFPNALLEAMAYGRAVVATDCPCGPRHIVRHRVDGILIEPESVEALARAMDVLIQRPDERARLGREAASVVQRFSLDRVLQRWDGVFRAVSVNAGMNTLAR